MADKDKRQTGRKGCDEHLALALAQGKTLCDAAAEVGVSETTAYRRWADPKFREQVAQLRADMVASAAGRLSSHMTAAADKLADLMNDPNTSVALGAAKSVLAMGFDAHNQERLQAQLEAIQQRLDEADEAKAGP